MTVSTAPLAVLDVGGADEVMDKVPDTSGAEADFREVARGGCDYNMLGCWHGGEEFSGAGERDDIGNVFEFAAEHPAVFLEMDLGALVGKKFLD